MHCLSRLACDQVFTVENRKHGVEQHDDVDHTCGEKRD